MSNIESKILTVKTQIEKDFSDIDKKEIEKFFERFQEYGRNNSFIKYYNKTVLDKEKINFGEFKSQWGIQGMTKESYSFFDKNFDKLKKEIIIKKDIKKFFKNYCCEFREEAIFCTKLFHTILPEEFPPIDNAIRKKFNLNEKIIDSVLIIKEGYKSFIEKNPEKIESVRNILSDSKFSNLRINELSDIRILDMYYWFKENVQ